MEHAAELSGRKKKRDSNFCFKTVVDFRKAFPKMTVICQITWHFNHPQIQASMTFFGRFDEKIITVVIHEKLLFSTDAEMTRQTDSQIAAILCQKFITCKMK